MRKPRGLSSSTFVLFRIATVLIAGACSLAVGPPATEPALSPRPATEPSDFHAAPIAATQPAVSPQVAEQIDALDDPDPAVRNAAANKLVAMGRTSFAALSRATRSDIPEVRLRAAELMKTMEMALFHLAKKTGHDAEMQARAIALGKLRPVNGPLLLEIYPVLMKAGDEGNALATFDATFLSIRNVVTAEGADPDPNQMNELAWICAMCNQHLEVAEKMARAAVAKVPARGAYVDTLAEVEFRLGHVNEAVQLETTARKLLPKDEQIRANLARYQAASARPTTKTSP